MNPTDLAKLLLFLTRECARLHALTEELRLVIDELRIVDTRLDGLDVEKSRKEAWQEFYAQLEDLSPEIAARLDPRTPEDF